ncbi:carboxylesterase/lipase family protein [Silvibacterium dinghuense]|uniref:Carboxylic ester hydrolase n=1 Tax=Silvibacterium dinghuense TaxID=1560006 RepID=A0A4V1NVZ9_9BACT|nr:carboxylesterase family protein [Silvibacterium dinghuense]RXS97682.1 carboxylesterase family protein [Silvibacterium dinghuense]GGH01104.1 carboxylic ester hydrolase [Silvibacterium dinghuense]
MIRKALAAPCPLFFGLVALLFTLPVHAAPTVKTTAGAVFGVEDSSAQVVSFQGIPFAAPPIGDLRWRAPQPPAPWSGIRAADHPGASCMQTTADERLPWTHEFLVHNQVSEDCLYLNVWTPQLSSSANLPVVVYIHGGGFVEGSGAVQIYDGTNLASTGLVVVTINYRLGIFGFFAHPELAAESPHHAAGNYGLMDQIAALRWVQANIRSFGGDPDRVTIWGQSAGAFSVGALLVSPEARGLFTGAMADSGLSLGGLPIKDLAAAEADGTKFASDHHAASLHDLRAMSAEELLKAQQQGGRFSPNIDGWILPAAPPELARRRAGSDVPVITGYQANDGLLSMPPLHSVADYEALARQRYGSFAGEYLRLYPAASDAAMVKAAIEASRDRDRVSMYLWAVSRGQSVHSPVFTYYFDRGIPWPQHPEYGAFHSGEIPYFFRNLKLLDRSWQNIDHQVSDLASAYLKAFASSGTPDAKGLPTWSPVGKDLPRTMEIGERTGVMPLADKAKLDFWTRYFHSSESQHAPLF